MRINALRLVISLSIIGFLFSCGKMKTGKSDDGKSAAIVKTQQLSDNSSFAMSNGERCTIVADATIDYPVNAGEGVPVDSLQRLFAAYVLESGDSLSLQEAMRQVVANSMHQYDFMREPVAKGEADD